MSRNSDRLGQALGQNPRPDPAENPPQATGAQSESTFSFVVPTEFVELPSKGRFYPENHPLYDLDAIEINLFEDLFFFEIWCVICNILTWAAIPRSLVFFEIRAFAPVPLRGDRGG